VAGSDLFTSFLAADQRLVPAAGRTDGRIIEADTVEFAVLDRPQAGPRWTLWYCPYCTTTDDKLNTARAVALWPSVDKLGGHVPVPGD